MSLVNDAAPAYNAGLTNPTGGRPMGNDKDYKMWFNGGQMSHSCLSEVRGRSNVRKV
jgi:hypothetical protein